MRATVKVLPPGRLGDFDHRRRQYADSSAPSSISADRVPAALGDWRQVLLGVEADLTVEHVDARCAPSFDLERAPVLRAGRTPQ